MKLYYTPGVCSLASHIVLEELGIDHELVKVDLATHQTEDGTDYYSIAPKGAVPFLELDNGEFLSEGAAILQYLADLKPEAQLAPANGTFDRVRLQEWLNYTASEFHKAHWSIFHKDEVGDQAAEVSIDKVKKAYDYLSQQLAEKDYAMGDQFTVVDAYLFTVINWHNFVNIDLSPWPVLVEYQKRVSARESVQRALQSEGLLSKEAA